MRGTSEENQTIDRGWRQSRVKAARKAPTRQCGYKEARRGILPSSCRFGELSGVRENRTTGKGGEKEAVESATWDPEHGKSRCRAGGHARVTELEGIA